jgi:DNA segregation ATPase FtsK/SpoIIIE, S-DNA-T family
MASTTAAEAATQAGVSISTIRAWCRIGTVAAVKVTGKWSETICTRLAEVNPDVYDGYDANLLGKAFRAHGVETEQMEYVDPDDPDGKRKNRKGITREPLLQALADR